MFAREGDNEKAEGAYTKAIESRVLNQKDRANRALVYIAMKDLDSAAEDVSILKKEAPTFFPTLYSEGLLEFYRGNYEQSTMAFEAALLLSPYYFRRTVELLAANDGRCRGVGLVIAVGGATIIALAMTVY